MKNVRFRDENCHQKCSVNEGLLYVTSDLFFLVKKSDLFFVERPLACRTTRCLKFSRKSPVLRWKLIPKRWTNLRPLLSRISDLQMPQICHSKMFKIQRCFFVRCCSSVMPVFTLFRPRFSSPQTSLVHWTQFTYTLPPSQTRLWQEMESSEKHQEEWRWRWRWQRPVHPKDTWNLMGCFGVHQWPSCTHQSLSGKRQVWMGKMSQVTDKF